MAARAIRRRGPAQATRAATAARAAAAADVDGLGALWANLADFRQVAAAEQAQLGGLATHVAPAPVVYVPVLRSDVHDLDGLAEVASHVFGRAPGA